MQRAWILWLGLAGCMYGDNAHELQLELGVITPTLIDVPDQVSIGTAFVARIRSWGDSCASLGLSLVAQSDTKATITIYDLHVVNLPADQSCDPELQPIEHQALLRFASAGPKTITFHGYDSNLAVIDLARTITVLPDRE